MEGVQFSTAKLGASAGKVDGSGMRFEFLVASMYEGDRVNRVNRVRLIISQLRSAGAGFMIDDSIIHDTDDDTINI